MPRVVLELDPENPSRGPAVLAAAIALFHGAGEVALVLRDVNHVQQAHAEEVAAVCQQVAAGAASPDLVLLGADEARRDPHEVWVRATGRPMDDAQAIVLLAAVAMRSWEDPSSVGPQTQAAPAAQQPAAPDPVTTMLAQRDALIRRRDLTAGGSRPTVAVVAQVQSTFGAVSSLCATLADDPEVDLRVVCVDSDHDRQEVSTAAYVHELGYPVADVDWLADQLADAGSPLRLVIFYDPWDSLRPEPARALSVANAGVRVAYLPYGNNVGAGEKIRSLAYDTPTHRLAWRVFARSQTQAEMFGKHCAVGNAHVRVLGLPKFDRVARWLLDPSVSPAATPPRWCCGTRNSASVRKAGPPSIATLSRC